MRTLHYIFMAIFSLFLFTACGDDDGDDNGNGDPQPSNNSFTATVAGNTYTAAEGFPTAAYNSETEFLTINAEDAEGNSIGLSVGVAPGTTGEFTVSGEQPNPVSILYTPADGLPYNAQEGAGSITLDTYSDGSVSGSFNATVTGSDGSNVTTLEITNGNFQVDYLTN